MQIKVQICSYVEHCSQILTGFYNLAKDRGYDLVIEDCVKNVKYKMAVVKVLYCGLTLIYDLNDGYLNIEGMGHYLSECDLYFKRSYSKGLNETLFPFDCEKIKPLGLNYFLTYKGSPFNKPSMVDYMKLLRGNRLPSYFTTDKFECDDVTVSNNPKILFYTRLWDYCDIISNEDIDKINQDRVDIVRSLKAKYTVDFDGGIRDSIIARRLAPDLISSKRATERKIYLKKLKSSDICIGTLGLHKSIGWKTAEYVAGAKGIVQEKLVYESTGDFSKDKNYLEFETVDECLNAVDKLYNDKELLYNMKLNNYNYYLSYLRPDKLVENSLVIADKYVK